MLSRSEHLQLPDSKALEYFYDFRAVGKQNGDTQRNSGQDDMMSCKGYHSRKAICIYDGGLGDGSHLSEGCSAHKLHFYICWIDQEISTNYEYLPCAFA
jgi:hypothetical protein